jgi:hypothetical protein
MPVQLNSQLASNNSYRLTKESLTDNLLEARTAYQCELHKIINGLSGKTLSDKDAFNLIKQGFEKKLFFTKYDVERARKLVETYVDLQENLLMKEWLGNLEKVALDSKNKDPQSKAMFKKIREYRKTAQAAIKTDSLIIYKTGDFELQEDTTNTTLDSRPTSSQGNEQGLNKTSFFDQFGGKNAFVEKQSSLKQVAHAWQIGGTGYINKHRFDLEGTRYIDFRKTFQKSLQNFSTTNNEILSLKETELLCTLLEEREVELCEQDAAILFEDFQKEKPVSISSGFEGHRVIIAFDKDYLIIANKGMATRRPIELYKISPEKITKVDFQEIINLSDKPEAMYKKWLNNISNKFNATKDPLSLFIEQAYPLSSYQQVGNCVWESLQTCVYGILMLHRLQDKFDESALIREETLIDTTNKVFLHWREFLQIQSLERYFCANRTPSNPLPCLTGNSKEESPNKLSTFEGIDQNLLRNVFRQFWSTKSTSIEFKQTMDKLESQYLKTLNGFRLAYAKTEKFYYNQTKQFPHIIKDLATVWTPSVLNTAIAAASYTLPPSIRPEPKHFAITLLLPSYLYSISRTAELTRRYFAI